MYFLKKQNVRGEKKSEGVESLSIPSAGLLPRQWDHQYERMARTIWWSGALPHIIIIMTLSIYITIVFIYINMRGCSGQYMLVWSLHINGNKMLPNANDWGSTVVC